MHADSPPPAIQTRQLSKSFGGVRATRAVDLTVYQGERRALIGPNGAGKSTLFGLITGEISADQGWIALFGQPVTRLSVRRRARLGLGRTYQISQLLSGLSVRENLFLAAHPSRSLGLNLLHGWAHDGATLAWCEEVAARVGLAPYLATPVAELSHGLQRQLEVGMTLAMKPRLIMLDEPAAGLSPAERQDLCAIIRELPADITLVLVEHDMDIVMQLSERITVLHQGAIVAEGSAAEVQADAMVQQIYLGEQHA
ncbi:ABC transporter ATP-binding protein [Castellaniella sp.]|uniref:ABC transporter ATP-binding protein n=1 Tax=Castellaniella sp. TaxID=1955812 RepID=UPI0035644B3D